MYSNRFNFKHFCFYFVSIVILGFINCRAIYATTVGIPDEYRWYLAIPGGMLLSLFVEIAIATDVSNRYLKQEALIVQNEILEKRQSAAQSRNLLVADRAHQNESAFRAVQARHICRDTYKLTVFATMLLLLELAAAWLFTHLLGEDDDWWSYITPVLGIILTPLAGYYSGVEIVYPKARRKLAEAYDLYAEQLVQDSPDEIIQAVEEFYLLDGLTVHRLQYPQAGIDALQHEEARLFQQILQAKNKHRCDELYRIRADILQRQNSEVVALQHEWSDRLRQVSEVNWVERDIQEKKRLIDQRYAAELEPIEREMQECGCAVNALDNLRLPSV